MPKRKSGLFDNKKYQNDYHRKLKRIAITFNPKDPEDMRVYEFLKTGRNVTRFIKDLAKSRLDELDAMRRAEENAREAERSLIGLEVPLVDGYKDEEAIKLATLEQHDIFIKIVYGYEIRIDLETKKVLTVRRMYLEDPAPARIRIC